MSRYLLPCKCGENLAVDLSQAGQTLACTRCGAPLDIPTMREIRQLQPDESRSVESTKAWSDAQGALFAGGLVVTILGLALCVYTLTERLDLTTSKPALPDSTVFDSELDQRGADEVHDMWMQIEQIGLGGREVPQYLLDREDARFWNFLLAGSFIIFAAGIGCVISAFVLKPKG